MADPELLRAMTDLRDRITLSLSPLLEYIALLVVQRADAVLRPRLKNARENRRLLIDWAARHEVGVELPLPLSGVTAFPLMRPWQDTTELCRHLGMAHRVLLVPGGEFDHPRRVRLGFGGDRVQMESGLAVLADVLAVNPHS